VARRYGDFALVSVAASVDHKEARVAIGGVAGRPLSFHYSEFAETEKVDASKFGAFANYIAEKMNPNSDLHASAYYRRSLATTLVEETLVAAFKRVRADN
jgi:carbon-monoxide dehydrogenase medium subunit/2-furoyl-CoA dehydrogenase FAD binding subunit